MANVNDRTALLAYHDTDEERLQDVESRSSSLDLDKNNGKRRWLFFGLKNHSYSVRERWVVVVSVVGLMLICGGFLVGFITRSSSGNLICNTVERGYQCHKQYSQLWGQYSPFFSLGPSSEISPAVPVGCTVTFAQVLSRHGARHPTKNKNAVYSELIQRVQDSTEHYTGDFTFLEKFDYPFLADDLTPFGESQMVDSGARFYQRYQHLTQNSEIFIRASGSPRVIASAEKFISGFHTQKLADPQAKDKSTKPSVGVIIPETPYTNNTLDHSNCDLFEATKPAHPAQAEFASTFAPPILSRITKNLPGANLSITDIPFLMDLCSFHTIALTPDARTISPFCSLFTSTEWTQYDYYNTLGKYYGHSAGNPLGASQGVGFVNELIARLTNTPVIDHTTVNHTLDSDPTTFPLNLSLYADFSHDNTMMSIFTALGLLNGTMPLSNTTVQSAEETGGYSAAWTVPFGGRAYVEKMVCDSAPVAGKEMVRVLVNDRVVPLYGCKVDGLGRCGLEEFVEGLSYARGGGDWGRCFV